jgi:hypothetical protein
VTPAELGKAASDAGAKGHQHVQLVLDRKAGAGRRMVVFAKPRLMGEVCCESMDDNGKAYTVVRVDAVDLLAWLAAAGLVEVRSTDGEVLS